MWQTHPIHLAYKSVSRERTCTDAFACALAISAPLFNSKRTGMISLRDDAGCAICSTILCDIIALFSEESPPMDKEKCNFSQSTSPLQSRPHGATPSRRRPCKFQHKIGTCERGNGLRGATWSSVSAVPPAPETPAHLPSAFSWTIPFAALPSTENP